MVILTKKRLKQIETALNKKRERQEFSWQNPTCRVCKKKIVRGRLCRLCYCTRSKKGKRTGKSLYDIHILD